LNWSGFTLTLTSCPPWRIVIVFVCSSHTHTSPVNAVSAAQAGMAGPPTTSAVTTRNPVTVFMVILLGGYGCVCHDPLGGETAGMPEVLTTPRRRATIRAAGVGRTIRRRRA